MDENEGKETSEIRLTDVCCIESVERHSHSILSRDIALVGRGFSLTLA